MAAVPADIPDLAEERHEDWPPEVEDDDAGVVDDPVPSLDQGQARHRVLAPVELAVPAPDRPKRVGAHEQVVGGEVVDVPHRPDGAEPEAQAAASEGRLVERPGDPLAP